MSSSDSLLKAAAKLLVSRMKKKFKDVSLEVALRAKEAPQKIQDEWQTFKEEVYKEASRIDEEELIQTKVNNPVDVEQDESKDLLQKIGRIRSKITEMDNKIEVEY